MWTRALRFLVPRGFVFNLKRNESSWAHRKWYWNHRKKTKTTTLKWPRICIHSDSGRKKPREWNKRCVHARMPWNRHQLILFYFNFLRVIEITAKKREKRILCNSEYLRYSLTFRNNCHFVVRWVFHVGNMQGYKINLILVVIRWFVF